MADRLSNLQPGVVRNKLWGLPFTQTVNGSHADHEVLVSGLSANTTFITQWQYFRAKLTVER